MTTNTTIQKRGLSRRLMNTSLIVFSFLVVSGCSAHATHYSDRHSQSRVSVGYEYYYYPDQNVYYDRHRRLYHYNHYRNGWLSVRILPAFIHLNHQRRHPLAYRHARPWQERHAYKRHHRYYDRDYYIRHQPRRYDNHYRDRRYERQDRRDARRHEHRREHQAHRDQRRENSHHRREEHRDQHRDQRRNNRQEQRRDHNQRRHQERRSDDRGRH